MQAVDSETTKVPTLMLDESIGSLALPYTELFSPEFLSTIYANVAAGGRRNENDVDNHMKKAALKDAMTSSLFYGANSILEKTLFNKLKNDNYALHIPIPLVYERYDCFLPSDPSTPGVPFMPKKLNGRYENFYFGKSAYDVSSTNDISIYPGTRKNISSRQNLTAYDYSQSQQDDIPLDYTARSVGASYGIASRQVEASR